MAAAKEHHIVFGLTDFEVSVLRGALQDRAATETAEATTCAALDAIVFDQLGPELPDGDYEVLAPGGRS